MGFWLELLSLPSRERGLKRMEGIPIMIFTVSLPSRERGLKHMMEDGMDDYDMCRSLRGSVD